MADTGETLFRYMRGATSDTIVTGSYLGLPIPSIKEPCPEQKQVRFGNLDCRLNDKLCVRENEDTCPYYDEYLQELKEEKEDELKEEMELEYEKEELFNEVKNESYYQ